MQVSDWISSVSAVATAIAAAAAGWSAKISLNQFKNQIKEKEESERPRLLPLNTNISFEVKSIFTDWDLTKPDITPIKERFVQSPIKMINTGKTFAVNIEYTYRLIENVDEFKDFEEEKDGDYRLKFIKYEDDNTFVVRAEDIFESIYYKQDGTHRTTKTKQSKYMNVQQNPRYHPILKSEESTSLLVPDYFVILTNHFIIQYSDFNEDIAKLPRLLLRLEYSDQHQNKYVDIYEMIVSTKHIQSDKLNYKGWIDFQLVHSEVPKKESLRYL